MKTSVGDFKHFLRTELIRRCRDNPRYSLRAFAKNLEMDYSTLSKILNGKRNIGKKTIMDLGLKLGLKESQLKKYIKKTNVQFSHAEFDFVSEDIFSVISDWYYYGILELLRIDDFKFSVQNVSKALGITTHEAQDALERLERLNMIRQENGKWTDETSGRSTNITSQGTSFARRSQQKQILTKAIDAIDNVPIELRSNTSMTFAVDTSKLKEASELIKNFRRDMAALLSRDEKRDEVYNLAVALYPISKIKSKGDNK